MRLYARPFRQRADAQGVAGRLNLKLVTMTASTEREIDAAFATFAQQQVGAVIIGSNPFFIVRREQIISLAAVRHLCAARFRRCWRPDELRQQCDGSLSSCRALCR